jgi:hypothetical protein
MVRVRDRADRWEEAALAGFLLLCFALSFLKELFPVLDRGLTAAIFLAIFFLLRQIRDLRLNLEKAAAREVFFSTNEEFYDSAREAVSCGKSEIRATYFRRVPPTKLASAESKEYFEEVVRFARTKGTVRRIIAVSNEAMAEWCKTQAELVREIPRYNIRVLDTVHQKVEPTSVVMIDDDVMYMAFSGPTDQQLGGIREDAPQLVRFHQNRFDQLWESGMDVETSVNSKEFKP